MTMAGSQTKEGYSVVSGENSGNKVSGHGFHVGTMANGDKFYVRRAGVYGPLAGQESELGWPAGLQAARPQAAGRRNSARPRRGARLCELFCLG